MQGRINIDSRELSRICPKVFSADGRFKILESGDPCWDYFVDITQWDGKCGSWAEYFEAIDNHDRPTDDEEDDGVEPVRLAVGLQSRKFQGIHTDGYGMYACEESLRALLEELNQIDCDVVMAALREHLSK